MIKDASAVRGGMVLCDNAVTDRQGSAVPNAAAVARGIISADRAAIDRDGTEVGENAAAFSYYWLARRRARESVVTDVATAGQLNGPVEDRTDPTADLDCTAGRERVVRLLDQ